MKKLLILITFLLTLMPATIFAQWYQINYDFQSPAAIQMLDQNTGYVMSGNGTTFRTTDCGNSWNIAGTSSEICNGEWNMYWANVLTGYNITGCTFGPNIVTKTTDGGMSWSTVNSAPSGQGFQCPYFFDPCNGIVVGALGLCQITTNCGSSWSSVSLPNALYYGDISFTNSLLGLSTGNNWYGLGPTAIIRTTNGGWSWTSVISLTNNEFNGISFPSQNVAYAVGGNSSGSIIYKSTNSGLNWNQLTINLNLSGEPYNVHFVNENTGWVTGLIGGVLYTSNGGTNWTLQTNSIPANERFIRVNFINAMTGFVCSPDGVWKTTNGGVVPPPCGWTELNSGSTAALEGIYFTDNNTGYIAGSGGIILKTTDAGNNWTSINTGTGLFIARLYFPNSSTGFATSWEGTILKTTNSGLNWVANQVANHFIIGIYFTDINTGYAVGNYGSIYKTTNSGLSWSQLSSQVSQSLAGVYFTDANTGYVSGNDYNGYNSVILKTTNGGLLWTRTDFPEINEAYTVFFSGQNTGYVVGNYNGGDSWYIMKTMNAGATWNIIQNGTGGDLIDIKFADINNGMAVGYYGNIMQTTNGGSNWFKANPLTTSNLYGAFFNHNHTGYAASVNGTILKYSDCANPCTSFSINAGNDTTIYYGYGLQQANLTAQPSGGSGPYTYLWSNNATTQSITVSPTVTTTYWVTVIDANGCSSSDTVIVNVIDIRCNTPGNNHKVLVCHNGHTICIDSSAVQAHLKQGDYLGNCGNNIVNGNPINDIPNDFKLYTNYPNPFNPTTKIKFDLPKDANIKLIIYDVLGREVAKMVDGEMKAGRYEYEWDASNIASGIYFYRIEAGGYQAIKKMVLLK